MKCRANRRDYNYNTAYDADGNLVSYDQGNIGDSWLLNSGTVVSVDFARSPNLTIGDFSFSNCGIQGDLKIPDNFISIGRNAFQNSNSIQDIYVNIPEENMFNSSNEQSPFYDGPVGKLYVTSQYILEYGGVGAFYPPTNGMEVALWADHKDSVVGEEVSPGYTITTPVNSVEEGISSVVTVNTTSVLSGTTLYWTLSKPSEFSVSSGSFTINNNVGTFNITPLLDQDIDPAEAFDIQIRTGSTSGPIVESKTITINDKTPTYTITANSSVDEGSSLSVTVDTTNVADQTLYWSSTETNDIDVSSGSFSLTNDQGTFSIPITADGISDPGETFTFVIRTGSVGGTIVATSDAITINDIANPPTYTVVPASSSVDEGVALNVTVNTTNVADSTTLYWTVTNASEFSTSSGSFVITSNTGSFSVTPTLDAAVDSDTFDIQIRTGSIAGTIVETTDTPITIVDKTPTYSLVHDNNVDEGSALNVTLNTANVDDQTLYWVVTSNAGDFSTSNGSFSLSSNTGSFSITPDADSTTEGAEQFFFVVKTGSINGTTVASSSGVTINDTSQTPGSSDWQQLGGDIDGVNATEEFGISVSYSEDNTDKYLVAGAHRYSSYKGRAEGWKYNDAVLGDWELLNDADTSPNNNDQVGYSVSLATVNGQNPRVAIGVPDRDNGGSFDEGSFRVSDLNYAGGGSSTWSDIGNEKFGGTAKIYIASSVSISSDGNVIAVGAPCRNPREARSNTLAGEVQVYEWGGSDWIAKGSPIVGEASNDEFGWSVSLSSDGSVLAVGAPVNNSSTGHVRVYDWNAGGGTWDQRGSDIDGQSGGDKFGWSVSLSADGNTLAVGTPIRDFSRGAVRVYDWTTSWSQRGSIIQGAGTGDEFGTAVSISSNGNKVAVGAPEHNSSAGHVQVYEWNAGGGTWDQNGSDIDGAAAGDKFGWSVSLSADGLTLAAGAPQHNSAQGHVRVFEFV